MELPPKDEQNPRTAVPNFTDSGAPVEQLAAISHESNTSAETESVSRLEITWPNEADPVKRVDTFLEDLVLICHDSEAAWKQVRNGSEAIKAAHSNATAFQNRKQRRNVKRLSALSEDVVLYGAAKSIAESNYDYLQQSLPADTSYEGFLEAGKAQHTQQLEMMLEKQVPHELMRQLPQNSEPARLLGATMECVRPYTQAFLTRDIVLNQLEALLQDDDAAKAFLSRLLALATSKPGAESYPGFLPIVATEVLQEGDNSALAAALQRIQPPAKQYATLFLQELMKQDSAVRRKELNVAVGVMRLMGNLVSTTFETSQDDWLRLVAQHIEDWPEELRNDLQAMTTRIHLTEWQDLKKTLKPFERPGRLPLTEGMTTVQVGRSQTKGPGSTQALGASASRSKKRPSQKMAAQLHVGQRDQDHLSVIDPETEQQALAHFAVVGRQTKPGTFELTTVSSLQELYENSNLAAYVKKHSEDKTLQPFFMAALEKLTVDAFDPQHTEKLKGVRFEIEGHNGAARRGYRLRPRGFSEVTLGPITRDTRIIFDIVPIDGEPTLVIHGAFIKQDIENMDGTLPRRKS